MKHIIYFIFICSMTILLMATGTSCCEQIIDREPVVHISAVGEIYDLDGNSIAGLEVTPCTIVGGSYQQIGSPVMTNEEGIYRIDITTRPWTYLVVKVKDIDGPANGGTFIDTKLVESIDYQRVQLNDNGTTWDFGTIMILFPSIRLTHKE